MFSPHTRGCSGELTELLENDVVFPAYAGMFRFTDVVDACVAGFPRIRGDVPLIPAMTEALTAFSPHTRGCSADRQLLRENNEVFPAYAGMFRRQHSRWLDQEGFPRIRGDVPRELTQASLPFAFSPHTRGCSSANGGSSGVSAVFPAYAGMFRGLHRHASGFVRFPRIRGDVPDNRIDLLSRGVFSPHTRGCSVM